MRELLISFDSCASWMKKNYFLVDRRFNDLTLTLNNIAREKECARLTDGMRKTQRIGTATIFGGESNWIQ